MAIEEKIKEKIKELEAIRKITYTTEQGGRKSVKVDGFARANGNRFFFVSAGNIVLFQAPTLHDLKKGRGKLAGSTDRATNSDEIRRLSRAKNWCLTGKGKAERIDGRFLYSRGKWYSYATGEKVNVYVPEDTCLCLARFVYDYPRLENVRF